ncbi:MAG: hypothetical protein HY071_07000 [Chloroflexi bacterium]|nr:hypothetical protein [Chloroflexota bacterium]
MLKGVWENVYGLLVEDGQLAVGIVVSLVVIWAAATYGGSALHENAGWLLLALLLALVVVNLYAAGHNARHKISA